MRSSQPDQRASGHGHLLICMLVALLAACTPFSSKLDSWNGAPIQAWLDIPDKGGEKVTEIRGPDDAGNRIYVVAVSKQCTVFWTVNDAGIIVAGRYEGSACKYYTQ
jgi:hypothetical protein